MISSRKDPALQRLSGVPQPKKKKRKKYWEDSFAEFPSIGKGSKMYLEAVIKACDEMCKTPRKSKKGRKR